MPLAFYVYIILSASGLGGVQLDLLAWGGGGHWILSASLREGKRARKEGKDLPVSGGKKEDHWILSASQERIEDKWICQPQGGEKRTIRSYLPASGKDRGQRESASLRGEERGPLDLICQSQGRIEGNRICQPREGKRTIETYLPPASGRDGGQLDLPASGGRKEDHRILSAASLWEG